MRGVWCGQVGAQSAAPHTPHSHLFLVLECDCEGLRRARVHHSRRLLHVKDRPEAADHLNTVDYRSDEQQYGTLYAACFSDLFEIMMHCMARSNGKVQYPRDYRTPTDPMLPQQNVTVSGKISILSGIGRISNRVGGGRDEKSTASNWTPEEEGLL